MKRLPLLVLGAAVACGGSQRTATEAEAAPVVSPKTPTRVPVKDVDDGDDGVGVQTSHGHMDAPVIEAGLAPHAGAFTDCYMTRVGHRRWLGGHVSLHWDIKSDGTITAVKLAESDLGAWPVEKCLLDVAKSASFGKPVGGDADFVIPLDFAAKGRSLQWDEDAGIKAVGKQLAKLDACARGKVQMPSDVTVTLYVGPHGQAQSVGFSSSATVLDDAWATCAEKAAMAWRLPDPRGQVAKLAVRYRPR